MIIEDYLLKKRKKNDTSINQDYRKIFLILDGTIVLSESDIKGFYVEIPKKEILLKIPKKSRNKLIDLFLKNVIISFLEIVHIFLLLNIN